MKFEGIETLLPLLSSSDHFIAFDLRAGYHHVDIFKPHQTYLGFSISDKGKDRFFIFSVLAFGLSSAGQVFTKVVRALVKIWRQNALRVVVYIDDGICMSSSESLSK